MPIHKPACNAASGRLGGISRRKASLQDVDLDSGSSWPVSLAGAMQLERRVCRPCSYWRCSADNKSNVLL